MTLVTDASLTLDQNPLDLMNGLPAVWKPCTSTSYQNQQQPLPMVLDDTAAGSGRFLGNYMKRAAHSKESRR